MRLEENTEVARPFAYADPRSLSQAWYDALYGSRPVARAGRAPSETAESSRGAAERSPEAKRAPAPVDDSPASAAQRKAGHPVTAAAVARGLGTALERARSAALARTASVAETAAAQRPSTRTDVALPGEGDGLRLLIRQERDAVSVIAVCDPAEEAHVASALASARAALAARGVPLMYRTRERSEG